MPTYTYECQTCHKQVEQFLKMADRDNPGPCECGGTLRKLITPATVMIDGTDPEFPSAAGKWDADRLRTINREQKNLQDSGDYYPNNRHW